MDPPRSVVRLDPGNAHVRFSVRWFGVINVRGRFDEIAGTIELPGTGSQEADVAVAVDSTSVRTGIALRDRHLRGLRFLDSGEHPVIEFASDHVSRHNGVWDVKGKLRLRGRQRDVSLSVRDEEASPSQRRLTAEFTVPRRPHAIGTARGIRTLNPLLWAIGADVNLHVELLVPATALAGVHAPAR